MSDLSERLIESLRKWAKDTHFASVLGESLGSARPELAIEVPDDIRPAYELGLDVYLKLLLGEIGSGFSEAIGHCESPIEVAAFIGLTAAALGQSEGLYYKVHGRRFGYCSEGLDHLIIEPQARLGEYRVDFLLYYHYSGPDFDNLVESSDGEQIPGVKTVTSHLIVECDGHDFHERTKSQASRDKARDRVLQKLGYPVFRYTGSDLWKDTLRCCQEAVTFLIQSSENKIWRTDAG